MLSNPLRALRVVVVVVVVVVLTATVAQAAVFQDARDYSEQPLQVISHLSTWIDFYHQWPMLSYFQQSSQSSVSQPSSSSSSVSPISQWTAQSSSQSGAAGTTGGAGLTTGGSEQDKKLKQYLEDERIALFLQNEEFMKELQRNREFLIALERGMTVTHSTEESCSWYCFGVTGNDAENIKTYMILDVVNPIWCRS